MRFSTRAIHAVDERKDMTGAVTTPIYQVSTFRYPEPSVHGEYVYSRDGNPTRAALEKTLASLEGGQYGFAFASGMAAISTVALSLLREGDHVLAVDDLYSGTKWLFDNVLRKFGVTCTYLDGTNLENIQSNLKSETKIVWLESPTNPLLRIIDIKGAAEIAHKHGAVVVVDNTFMSPYLQLPLSLGADVVVHSTTKYLGGHSDVVGGAVILSNPEPAEKVRSLQIGVGAVAGPWDSWLVLRGVKTLSARMEAHCSNAQKLSEFLSQHNKIRSVIYPGLPTHPQHQLSRKQMKKPGGMVSFYLKGNLDSCAKLLKSVKVFTVAESLGGVESLIEHPATMTHASVPKDEREKIGITDSLIRLSVGIENIEDLIADLSTALDQV